MNPTYGGAHPGRAAPLMYLPVDTSIMSLWSRDMFFDFGSLSFPSLYLSVFVHNAVRNSLALIVFFICVLFFVLC
ncbi:hypothetical protein, partial [Streptomyces sp. Mg1]|uniref:hypothetical protein n=1 Tax=Streptomyces sp. Mg1 TaxID=465541 RepID=UPI001F2BB033